MAPEHLFEIPSSVSAAQKHTAVVRSGVHPPDQGLVVHTRGPEGWRLQEGGTIPQRRLSTSWGSTGCCRPHHDQQGEGLNVPWCRGTRDPSGFGDERGTPVAGQDLGGEHRRRAGRALRLGQLMPSPPGQGCGRQDGGFLKDDAKPPERRQLDDTTRLRIAASAEAGLCPSCGRAVRSSHRVGTGSVAGGYYCSLRCLAAQHYLDSEEASGE